MNQLLNQPTPGPTVQQTAVVTEQPPTQDESAQEILHISKCSKCGSKAMLFREPLDGICWVECINNECQQSGGETTRGPEAATHLWHQKQELSRRLLSQSRDRSRGLRFGRRG